METFADVANGLACGCVTDWDENGAPRWVRGKTCHSEHAMLRGIYDRVRAEAAEINSIPSGRPETSGNEEGVGPVLPKRSDVSKQASPRTITASGTMHDEIRGGRVVMRPADAPAVGVFPPLSQASAAGAPDFIGGYALPGLGQVQLAFKHFAVFINAGEVDAVIAGLSEAAAILRGEHPAQTDVWIKTR